MRRNLTITSVLLAAATAAAGTFTPAPYLADAQFGGQVDALTRTAARQLVDRDLFGTPWATVVVGHVDVYDRFPYLESHYFQVVSDPAWNRLVAGEVDRGLTAFDGTGTVFGPLREPRGLATDGNDRVYVADTGNDRVLVFRAVSEFDELRLEPLYSLDGLSAPWDVACSDAGTPLDAGDDLLYVADTGRNEIVRFALTGDRRAADRRGRRPGQRRRPLRRADGAGRRPRRQRQHAGRIRGRRAQRAPRAPARRRPQPGLGRRTAPRPWPGRIAGRRPLGQPLRGGARERHRGQVRGRPAAGGAVERGR